MRVRVENQGWVRTIILQRPEVRNAIDRQTAEELLEACLAFNADDSARVAVLWGEGGSFCAGADLRAIAAGTPNRLEVEGAAPLGPSRLLLSKPMIAAVSGHAVAGGLELALWCDLRIVEEDAVMGVFCRRWGVPLIDGGTQRLPAMIGLGRALDLILTGRPVLAPEALAIGLATRVVPKGEARLQAEALAAQLAELPQAALRADRQAAIEGSMAPDGLQREFLGGVSAVTEGALGAAQFLQRR